MTNKCSYCRRIIRDLPFKCRYCGKYYCSKHRLPEDHKCHELEEYKKGNKERWKKIIKSEFEYKPYKPHRKTIPYKHKSSLTRKSKKHLFKKFIKKYWFPILLVLLLLFAVAYARGYYSIFFDTCEDKTLYNRCSLEKPYFCFNGTLVKNSTFCGCSYGYEPKENDCVKKPTCSDGSFYSECGATKPFYCYEGTLVEKASICGCPRESVKEGEKCISQYQTNPKTIKLSYLLNGKKESFNHEVYGGLNNYLANLPRGITYSYIEPTTKEFIMKDLNEENQKQLLLPLVNEIKQITSNKDNQARIAISIVQNIPYDWGSLYSSDLTSRYPYEVLYDMRGVCGEKSELLVFLLKELGFGVSTFEFNLQNHRAVGIKCPSQYDYKDSGYCFIETTTPSIITDDTGYYVGVGKLEFPSEIITISEGNSFDSVSEEYNDALEWINLNEISNANDGYLSSSQYNRWWKIVRKYGIELEEFFDYEKDSYYDIEFEEFFDYETGVPEIDFPSEVESDEPYCPPLTKAELLDCHSISRDPQCPKTQTELRCN